MILYLSSHGKMQCICILLAKIIYYFHSPEKRYEKVVLSVLAKISFTNNYYYILFVCIFCRDV